MVSTLLGTVLLHLIDTQGKWPVNYRRILTENFVGWKIMGLMGWIVLGQKMLGMEKREHIFHKKERYSIQFNAAELLAASGPSPSSVHSYKITKQVPVISRSRSQNL